MAVIELMFMRMILALIMGNKVQGAAIGSQATSPTPFKLGCGKADIVFILDQSNSISEIDMGKAKQFISNVIEIVDISREDNQVGLLSFAGRAYERFRLDRFLDKELLQKEVANLERLNSPATNTHLALQMLRNRVRSSQFGSRPGVAKIAIVITDGASSNPALTYQEARLVHQDNIIVFAIGVGKENKRLNQTELRLIASDPDEYYAFLVDDWEALNSINHILRERSCQGDTTLAPWMSKAPQYRKRWSITTVKSGKRANRVRHQRQKKKPKMPKAAGAPKPPLRYSDEMGQRKRRTDTPSEASKALDESTPPPCVCTCPSPQKTTTETTLSNDVTTDLPNVIPRDADTTPSTGRGIIYDKNRIDILYPNQQGLDGKLDAESESNLAPGSEAKRTKDALKGGIALRTGGRQKDVMWRETKLIMECKPTDILFVPSNTAGPLELNSISIFVETVTNSIQSEDRKFRVGILPLECKTWAGISLRDLTNKDRIFEKLKKNRLDVSSTSKLISETRKALRQGDDSSDARKVAVLFVEHSSKDVLDAIYQARQAQEEDIEMYVIGVGKDYNLQDAKMLSSLPARTYFITVQSYGQLHMLAPLLLQELSVCKAV